jgi:CRISPR-associated Csx14 family protein
MDSGKVDKRVFNTPGGKASSRRFMPATLIATLGSEPQVVTAALDLLRRDGEGIQRVIVVHSVAREDAIAQAVSTLKRTFSQPPYRGKVVLQLSPLSDAAGNPFADLDTPEAVQAVFRILYNQVRLEKKAGHKVHLSIAGGRKTMAIFGMVTAQLLFDENDRLWHLYSSQDFIDSKQLHPGAGDEVNLVAIPVIHWSAVSPIFMDLSEIEDPLAALERQKSRHLAERLEQGRAFLRGSLTPAEGRVAALLVQHGLSDQQIAQELTLSPRTVEQHLRSIYIKAANHWDLAHINRAQLIALLNMVFLVEGGQ